MRVQIVHLLTMWNEKKLCVGSGVQNEVGWLAAFWSDQDKTQLGASLGEQQGLLKRNDLVKVQSWIIGQSSVRRQRNWDLIPVGLI